MARTPISRRDFITGAIGGAAALALGGMGRRHIAELRGSGIELVRKAAQARPAGSDLGAVEHVVFLMHENRSFDHYFGTLGSVNGFDAPSPAFSQPWSTPGALHQTLLPFHLDPKTQDAACTYDLSHSWPAQHASWNGGAMDQFVNVHTSSQYESARGVVTMGYYEEQDIPFYYALAQAFTICDAYFCSVLGPTHPNRLLHMTGTLDPGGVAGGPILVTNSNVALEFTCSWTTMPEVLSAHNVSWKCYNPHGSVYAPGAQLSLELSTNPLLYFRQYSDPASMLWQNAFGYYGPNVKGGLTSRGPNDFAHDVRTGQLPTVSWIFPPDGYDEHPPAPAALGEWYTYQILKTLLSNQSVWAKTVLFVMYDENDGFFDHVSPPQPAPTDAGEWITVDPLPADAGGITGPIGLGVRVPMLVVSPFSAGGWVCSDVFDHTSQLRFLETLFGTPVPNLSSWRRSVTGDLTTALPTLSSPVTKRPKLPKQPALVRTLRRQPIATECSGAQLIEENPATPPYPVPSQQQMPVQGGQVLKRT